MNTKEVKQILRIIICITIGLIINYLIVKNQPTYNYDFNKDNQVNVIDLAIVKKTAESGQYNKRMDFNNDGVIDDKDIQILKSIIINY